MTASRGIRKSTKWKTVASQQAKHTLEALHAIEEQKSLVRTWEQRAMMYRRSAVIGLMVSVVALFVAFFR